MPRGIRPFGPFGGMNPNGWDPPEWLGTLVLCLVPVVALLLWWLH